MIIRSNSPRSSAFLEKDFNESFGLRNSLGAHMAKPFKRNLSSEDCLSAYWTPQALQFSYAELTLLLR